MQSLVSAAQMRELDRIAIEERGIPSLELMEQAAQAVAGAVMELVPLPERRRPDGPIASGFSSVILTSSDGKEPTEEEQRELDELRAVVESKNTDPVPRVAVFCGPGNNGGDGIAAALLLIEAGYHVRAFLIGDREKMTPDAREMKGRLETMGRRLEAFTVDLEHPERSDRRQLAWLSTCDCVVDALFGVGLSRPVSGEFLNAVRYINRAMATRCPVVACDIPSGVHADTGEVLGEAVRATVTVTFTCGKPGLYLGRGGACAGEVRAVDIGIPFDLVIKKVFRSPEAVQVVDQGGRMLPRRDRLAHKGDFGKVLILAGSVGFTGAPVLAANAAVRAGAGLVYLGVPKEIYSIVAVKCDEAMPFPLPDRYEAILARARSCDAALIGPGLGRAAETEELVLRLLADLDIPVVLDADGLNALAGHLEVLDGRTAPTVLTPHEGEFARLTGCALPIRDRLAAARNFAGAHRCTLVLKGHGTVTAGPDGGVFINTTGNPGMARGGSGDALAGLLAGLLGQRQLAGDSASELAAWAVYFHGRAGDLAAAEKGEYGMTVGDLTGRIPEVLRENEEKP